jgi:NAD(P)H-dependent flavin oxidoreductase YrpB (nitropropane dioxygenase family)
MWPDNRIQNLFGIELPIIQAPMAGAAFSEMVIGVSEAGGLGSLACALLTTDQIIVSRLSRKWRERSAVKIRRTREERTKALHR